MSGIVFLLVLATRSVTLPPQPPATQVILGNLGGYANQAGKTGGYLRDLATGDQRPRGLGDLLGGLLYGSPDRKNTKNPFTAAQDAVSGE